jgi:hypothetical protein
VTIPLDRPPAAEAGPELLVLQKWEAFAAWFLNHTARWPKAARFTLTQRLENHALDVTELLVAARYDPRRRKPLLHDVNLRLERLGLPVRFANMTSVFTTEFTRPSRYAWMLQYYLRLEAVAASWIGTGRFIFSHAMTDERFGEFSDAFERACVKMREDGFFWTSPELTAAAIKKRVTREMLSAAFGKRRRARAASADVPASIPTTAAGPEPQGSRETVA